MTTHQTLVGLTSNKRLGTNGTGFLIAVGAATLVYFAAKLTGIIR